MDRRDTLDAGSLAPGRYALRAVVSLGAAEAGRVVQSIEIGRP